MSSKSHAQIESVGPEAVIAWAHELNYYNHGNI